MFLLANRHFRQASKDIPGLAPCQWAERYHRLIYEPCRRALDPKCTPGSNAVLIQSTRLWNAGGFVPTMQ